jgi:DNA-binding transcriptional MerR regulator
MAADASPLDRYRDAELTLEDLVAAAARLLKRLGLRSDDGRVAVAPDARGVRYYQGIGVLDRPLRYDGRRAVYGFRHLLQLLAVKQLQQEGHPLHLIQQSLAGRPAAALEQALGTMLAGGGSGRGPEPKARAAEPVAALVAARLALGVTVTVDPTVVADPDALIAHIAAILAGLHKEH